MSSSAAGDRVGMAGIPPFPFMTAVRVTSAPNRLTASAISGPRSPLRSGPWQTWQLCSYTVRPCRSAIAGAARGPPRPVRGRSGIRPPEFSDVDSPAGTSLTMEGMSLPTTYTVPFVGSAAVPKNRVPPLTLGIWIVSPKAGGVYNPVRAFERRSIHHGFSASVMNASYMSFTVIP